ncbi:MAG: TSUP family transporter [Rhizobiaceae bacterium]
MMTEFAQQLILLAGAAFLGGFVDAIAGGGGLITVPALLLAGLSPVEALGTNKLQGMFGSASATLHYAAKGHVDLRGQLPFAMLSVIGGGVGAGLATIVPDKWLSLALPVVLIAIALYFALKPNLGDLDRARRMGPVLLGCTLVPLVAMYDGIFGPGAGSFFMIMFISLAGYGVLKATAHTKLLNVSSNAGSFLVFAVSGAVLWKIGLVMGLAQFLGARIGAALAIRVGSGLIKPLLVVVCIALAVKLLADPAHPLRQLVSF